MTNKELTMEILKIQNAEEFEQIGKIAKELGLCHNDVQCTTCLPQLNCPRCETFNLAKAVYKAGYGNVVHAVKDFMEKAEIELDKLTEHYQYVGDWNGECAVSYCVATIKLLFNDLYGEGKEG